jgi:hypothetical protein
MKMEPIEGSETSAISAETPGKHPKENMLQGAYLCVFTAKIFFFIEHLYFYILAPSERERERERERETCGYLRRMCIKYIVIGLRLKK